jgi:hypothetical protein
MGIQQVSIPTAASSGMDEQGELMKEPPLRTSLNTLLAVAAAYSQPSPIRAVIPFGFVAGGLDSTAGEYAVDQTMPGVIIIKSAPWRPLHQYNLLVLSPFQRWSVIAAEVPSCCRRSGPKATIQAVH